MKARMKGFTLGSLLGFTLLLSGFPAVAGELRTGDDVIISSDEIIEDDLYVTANTFILDGVVRGDVMAGARTITINGTVEGDLMVGGQTITINGTVTDDVRLGGANLVIGPSARIGDDVSAAGYSLETKAGSIIEGGLGFSGWQILLAGDVTEDALIGAYGVELRGAIGGNVEAEVSEPAAPLSFDPTSFIPGIVAVPSVPAGLTLGSESQIGGDLELITTETLEVPGELVFGEVRFEEPAAGFSLIPTATRNPFWANVRRYVALAVIGLLLIWLLPGLVRRPAELIEQRPWPSLGVGVLTLMGAPLAFAITAGVIVLLAIGLGLVTLGNLSGVVILGSGSVLLTLGVFFFLTVTYMTQIIVGYLSGKWLLAQIDSTSAASPGWALLLGLLLVVALTAIPYLGPVVTLGIVVFGLGSLWLRWREGPRGASATPERPPHASTRIAMQ